MNQSYPSLKAQPNPGNSNLTMSSRHNPRMQSPIRMPTNSGQNPQNLKLQGQIQQPPQPNSVLSISGVRPTSLVRYIQPQYIVQQIQPPQMVIHQRVHQPIQVVDLRQIEEAWHKKIRDMEESLKGNDSKIIIQEDTNRVDDLMRTVQLRNDQQADLEDQVIKLQDELKHANSKNEVYKKQISNLQQQVNESNKSGADQIKDRLQAQQQIQSQLEQVENLQSQLNAETLKNNDLEQDLQQSTLTLQNYRSENDELHSKINYFKDQLDEKDKQIEDLLQELDDTRLAQEDHAETTTHYLTNEVNTWKTKFTELNSKFHKLQEELMLTEAELEQSKKLRGSQIQSSTDYTKRASHNQNSSESKFTSDVRHTQSEFRGGSEYEASALNPQDLERLKRLQLG